MDPMLLGIITVVCLFILILCGVHVGVSLAAMSFVGVYFLVGKFHVAAGLLGATAYDSILNYTLAVVPTFVLMGLLANASGATKDLYGAANIWLGGLRGGLAIATVAANAIFSAVSGVSIASAAMFSKISLPQMLAHGYDKRLSLGTVAGSSILGMLIPPSILLIIYGILANESIGRLFVAGVVPGMLLSLIYSVGIWLMIRFRPHLVSDVAVTEASPDFRTKVVVTLKAWGVGALILLVLGGMYGGFFTPTEAGGVGAFGALILAIIKRRLNLETIKTTLVETGHVTASIFLLLIAAQMYSRMVALTGIPTMISDYCASLAIHPLLIVTCFLAVYIVLGTVLDSISMLLITVPLMIPVVRSLGFDPVWFGILSIISIEMGLLTPPFGLVVFAMKASLGEEASIEEIFRGSLPFLFMMLLLLAILVFFPWLTLWLPSLGI